MDNVLIELKDIKKEYGKEQKIKVLKGVNLLINRAEFLSIIGPSGSGKSTLLNILGTLDKPSSGSYYFGGNYIETYSEDKLSEFRNTKIGFVFQFHHLLPEFTALENVLMPFRITRRPIDKKIIERAEKYLQLVGVLERKNNKSTNMSGGQQQRTAIARALINEPEIIFADEPTGNLDSESTEQVYNLMRSINKELGTTFVIVTHDRHLAAKSDRIIEILDGNIERDFKTSSQDKDSVWDEIRPCNCMYRNNKELA
jgi:lipoprotein-releasing system ATP-binding protein